MSMLNSTKLRDTRVIEIVAGPRPRFEVKHEGRSLTVVYRCPCGATTSSPEGISQCPVCKRRP